MHEKSLIRLVNKDLKKYLDLTSIAQYKISQFSNNMISNLLRELQRKIYKHYRTSRY